MAHVSKRGNSFRIRVCTGTLNGKPIIKNTTYKPPAGTPPKKAEQLAQAYAVEYENHCKGFSQLNENMKFSELADWYFENYAPNELKGSTAYTYLGQYNNHIKPLLGHVRIKDINPPKLSQLMQTIELNPTSVKKLYVVMQSIFHRGVEQGFIRESPCHDVILPKRKKSTKNKAVEEDKLKRFLEFIEEKPWDMDVKRIIMTLLYTGMRAGECLGLSWDDVDFEHHALFVRHTLSYDGKEYKLTEPKTENSISVIGMGTELERILHEQKKYTDTLRKAFGRKFPHPEMVFPSANGNYRDRHSVYVSLKRMTKGTEFEDMTLHKLRHCNATMLLNLGYDIKIVSERLGHCNIGITADIYADVLQNLKKDVAEQIELKLK